MIDINEAVNNISEIHHQLSKTSIYRGYKPIVVGISGILGITASIIQPFFIKNFLSVSFVIYWVIVAAINLTLCTLMILYQYFFKENIHEKQKTICIMTQFIPMIIAGAIITLFFTLNGDVTTPFLPAIWAMIFSLGIFNIRPYLTNLTIISAAFYLLCSVFLFYLKSYNLNLLSFGMGLTFGFGQIISAIILYLSIEKINNGKNEREKR